MVSRFRSNVGNNLKSQVNFCPKPLVTLPLPYVLIYGLWRKQERYRKPFPLYNKVLKRHRHG